MSEAVRIFGNQGRRGVFVHLGSRERIGVWMQGGLKGKHVLIVEDEYLLAEDLRMTQERFGADVLGPVHSVGEAMASVADHPELDGAVLDMNLRGKMEFPVADMRVARAVPFLFTTGYTMSALPDRYAGVERFEKPFDPETVAEALGRRLAEPRRG